MFLYDEMIVGINKVLRDNGLNSFALSSNTTGERIIILYKENRYRNFINFGQIWFVVYVPLMNGIIQTARHSQIRQQIYSLFSEETNQISITCPSYVSGKSCDVFKLEASQVIKTIIDDLNPTESVQTIVYDVAGA